MNKILIIRLSAIGDIVMASPVAQAIKNNNPECEIHWLCQPECKSLLDANPNIDKIILWPRKDWESFWQQKKLLTLQKEINRFKKQLKAEKYDLALDLQGLLKSGFLLWLSGANKKIGLGSKEGSQWLVDENIARNLGDNEIISSEYRTLSKHLTNNEKFELKNYYFKETLESAKEKLFSSGVSPSKPFIAFCPFTTRPQKHWFDDYWQQLSHLITEEKEYPIILLGGPADTQHAKKITDGTSIISLAGKTSLSEAAAIIEQTCAVVGVDTGLTHMGHAGKTPTLCLFGSTKPYLKTGLANSKVLHYPKLCTSGKHDPRPDCSGCMRDLTPEIAFNALNKLIRDEAAQA